MDRTHHPIIQLHLLACLKDLAMIVSASIHTYTNTRTRAHTHIHIACTHLLSGSSEPGGSAGAPSCLAMLLLPPCRHTGAQGRSGHKEVCAIHSVHALGSVCCLEPGGDG